MGLFLVCPIAQESRMKLQNDREINFGFLRTLCVPTCILRTSEVKQHMQFIIMLAIALTAVMVTLLYRNQRDREQLTARVANLGGEVIRLARVQRGHPFKDTGRGWWAWRVEWRQGTASHLSWALTTREGIKEWRD